jgi:hypothetical protein
MAIALDATPVYVDLVHGQYIGSPGKVDPLAIQSTKYYEVSSMIF